ncbi:MAG: hypothetical protein A3J49_11825 [Gallionellales bacterium RIFCSPHIGHO2_02_FULL_57_16]|nr:MAG: hypothetical protein A3J49_11825 [Gallionellales bacterium RIFCSPHIGHO2_02_FULL_57_16]
MRLRPLFTLAAFALDEMSCCPTKAYPADQVGILCGSSGKFQMQIRQRAPFDMIEHGRVPGIRSRAMQGVPPGARQTQVIAFLAYPYYTSPSKE